MYDIDPVNILSFHRFLLADTKVRLENYHRAISQTVRPGDVVLDLGAGTGILSFFACQAGAKRVYAVEVGEVAELARLLCLKNGLGDRVVFLNDASYRIDLPERVDILITDTFGTFGLQGGGLKSIVDARQRLLKQEAVIVPNAVQLFVAPVESPHFYHQEIDFWTQELYGLHLSPIRAFAVNNQYSIRLDQKALLADPASLARLHLSHLKDPVIQGEVSLMAKRDGLMHGLCGWFVADLAKGIVLSNEPNITTTNYAQAFFPLEHPVSLDEGDSLKFEIRSYDSDLWRWQVAVNGQETTAVGLSVPKASFDHSTFWGFPMSRERLLKQASSYAPKLSARGSAELLVLTCFNGERTIEEIEKELLSRFPDEYESQSDASAFVREVVKRCA